MEVLGQTRFSRPLVHLLPNIHHQLRCHRTQIELPLFRSCILKSSRGCRQVASKTRTVGFKDQTMNESREESQEQILEMLAATSIEQGSETQVEKTLGQMPDQMTETHETIGKLPTTRAEIMNTKNKPTTMMHETETPNSQAMITQEIAIASLEASTLKTCRQCPTCPPYRKSLSPTRLSTKATAYSQIITKY